MAQPHEVSHGWMHGRVFKVKADTTAHHHDTDYQGNWLSFPFTIKAGTKVKVVMVSRLGDCGITEDLTAEHGYTARVPPEDLEIIL